MRKFGPAPPQWRQLIDPNRSNCLPPIHKAGLWIYRGRQGKTCGGTGCSTEPRKNQMAGGSLPGQFVRNRWCWHPIPRGPAIHQYKSSRLPRNGVGSTKWIDQPLGSQLLVPAWDIWGPDPLTNRGGKTTRNRLPRSTNQQSVMPAPNSTGRPSKSVEATSPMGSTQRSKSIHPLPGATPTKPSPGSMRAGWVQANMEPAPPIKSPKTRPPPMGPVFKTKWSRLIDPNRFSPDQPGNQDSRGWSLPADSPKTDHGPAISINRAGSSVNGVGSPKSIEPASLLMESAHQN